MPDTTCHMSISLDGFVAGPDQSRENPLGKRGMELHAWHIGDPRANEADEDSDRVAHAPARRLRHGPQHVRADPRRVGRGLARLVGRRAAVPRAGVRAHPSRPRADRDGGRDDLPLRHRGLRRRLRAAREAAGDDGVDIAGGASTVRQALVAGVIDELTLDIAPVLLGSGERIFDGVESFGFEPVEVLHSPLATHIRYRRIS